MKAWRKHNMQQSRALKKAEAKIAYTSEVKAPSAVLWNLLERVGIVQSA